MTSTDHPTDVLVAIVGAGPGGLLLAAYLQQHLRPDLAPHVKVFESDSDAGARAHAQGGSLDLHSDTGLYAIRSVGLYEKFREKTREGAEEMRVIDAVTGELLLKDEGAGSRPEIDRADLQDILRAALRPDTIAYGHRLTSASPSPAGRAWTLSFQLAPPRTTQILIGADGAWSNTRALLTPATPLYTGLSLLDMQIPARTLAARPELSALVGRGTAFILGGARRALIPQRNASGVLRVYAALREPERWLDDALAHEPLAGDRIRGWFAGFAPAVLALLDAAAPAATVPRRIYALPPELTWERPALPAEDGAGGLVALLGDSAHVMSPMAGEGVNLALRDAVELGKTLSAVFARSMPMPVPVPVPAGLSTPETTPTLDRTTLRHLNEGLEAYEKLMFRRAKQAGIESAANIDICFHPDSPRPFVEKMKTLLPPNGLGLDTVRWFGRTTWSEGWKWAEREGWW